MASGENILKNNKLFKSLDTQFINEFVSKVEERSYSKDSILYVESSEGDEIFLILEGSVQISAELANSQSVSVEEDNFFGLEMAIQTGTHSVTATANTDIKVWVWKTADWQSICETNPKEGYHLLLAIAQELHKRMHVWTEAVLNNASWGIE